MKVRVVLENMNLSDTGLLHPRPRRRQDNLFPRFVMRDQIQKRRTFRGRVFRVAVVIVEPCAID